MLRIRGLETAYGRSQVLFGVTLDVHDGEVVALLGRNGMGKSTTVNSIMGIVSSQAGEMHFLNRPLDNLPSHRRAQLGLGLVPEGRQIFPNLTVRENLVATARTTSKHVLPKAPDRDEPPWTMKRIFDMFPVLGERQTQMGSLLSGGEQQMLALGRALMTNPRLLILDEATEGLAPLVRREIWACIEKLKADGQAILVIDKNIKDLARVADRHYILEKGHVVWEGTSQRLVETPDLLKRYLGV